MIPDPGEMMEARAERMEDLYRNGLWHCCECGKPIKPGHENQAGPDPAAPPICDECVKKYCQEMR